MSSARSKVFFAFPSTPENVFETINLANEQLTAAQDFELVPWTNLRISGRVVIERILESISSSTVLAADVTGLNHNVLFELGYALGSRLPVWLCLNNSEPAAKDNLSRFTLLRGIGYVEYANHHELVNQYYADPPWENDSPIILSRMLESPASHRSGPTLLYMKSPSETDTSVAVTDVLHSSDTFGTYLIVDDPVEAPQDQLAWFVSHVRSSDALVVHLRRIDDPSAQWHNAKCSLIAGLALALERHLLIVADAPFRAPFDYQDSLKVVQTAAQARQVVSEWLKITESDVSTKWQAIGSQRTRIRQAQTLQELNVGESIAENERSSLEEVFVETSAYLNVLRGGQGFFIGRKGTGKTANMYRASSALSINRENLVCILKPVSFDLEAVMGVVAEALSKSERGYLVEAVWKLLIYTEVASILSEDIAARPLHIIASDAESALLRYMEARPDFFVPSYAQRIASAVAFAEDAAANGISTSSLRFSEALHHSILSDLPRLLQSIVANRRRLSVFVDNLDKAWDTQTNVDLFAEFVLGLLGVIGRVPEDLSGERNGDPSSINLVVFLRTDIFRVVLDHAREEDKIAYERIEWTDRELLASVIDKRLSRTLGVDLPPAQLWERIAVPGLDGIHVRDFAASAVLPRPRDIIQFFQAAVNRAVDRGHVQIEAEDLIAATEDYSEYALRTLYAEDDPRAGILQDVLIEFAGLGDELTLADVSAAIAKAGATDSEVDSYIDLLCDLNFLGLLNQAGEYEYVRDEDRRRVLRRSSLAPKRRKSRQRSMRTRHRIFQVNPVFHYALDIQSRTA